MTTSPLPDLFPHLVPDGGRLHQGQRYVNGLDAFDDRCFVYISMLDWTYTAAVEPIWTETAVPAPRPVPPTELGTVLIDVTTTEGCSWDRAYYTPSDDDDIMPWHLAVFHGVETEWAYTEDLVSWTVADVTPRTVAAPDPLDETDHRDRIERRGKRLTWNPCGRWHAYTLTCTAPHTTNGLTLSNWADTYGPIRFADEVTA